MPTIRVEDDIFASLMQIALDLSAKEHKKVNPSETIRMLITFCPVVDKSKLTMLARLY